MVWREKSILDIVELLWKRDCKKTIIKADWDNFASSSQQNASLFEWLKLHPTTSKTDFILYNVNRDQLINILFKAQQTSPGHNSWTCPEFITLLTVKLLFYSHYGKILCACVRESREDWSCKWKMQRLDTKENSGWKLHAVLHS